ncbi:MAG: bifunctional nuclease family protein [Candidatus Aenigmarchaeota archaeon]|nr:bifunctional nuclease family protein [Candidatus Aenigmarchaeota archaeon]
MKTELIALAGIGLFLLIVLVRPTAPASLPEISVEGFVPVKIEINGSDMILSGECRSILMAVSEHQALSIASALNNEYYIRPLTHDLMRDIFENYKIELNSARIDSFTDGVYTAKIYVTKDSKILEMDARPTDAAGIALRMGVPLYFNEDLLKINGEKIC